MMTKPLFDSFDNVSAKEWKQKIQADLKGADYNEALIYKSHEGIDIKPFYNIEDLPISEHTINNPTSWKNTQEIKAEEASVANKKALLAIEKGAESIYFIITSEDIDPNELLQAINRDVYIETLFLSESYIHNLNTIASTTDINISVLTDIVGNLAKTGNWYTNLTNDFNTFNSIIAKNTSLKNVMSIDISLYQNSGATMIQQLAYGLAHANEYLNHLDQHQPNTIVSPSIIFKTSVAGNYFFEIAKLRALRILWTTLAAEYDTLKSCQIITQPSLRNKTILDYNVNMLRTTTECMSAILGGADVISNLRYDEIYSYENDFGTRIALNQLLILKNESYFNMVSNPAAGSYYIESLTDQFVEKGLALFKNIEKGGGFLSQLKAGVIQKKIKESATKEQELFDEGRIILTGANKYQNKGEIAPTVEKLLSSSKKSIKTLINPVKYRRLSEKTEKNLL